MPRGVATGRGFLYLLHIMAIKKTKRKAFNFLRSYYDVLNELNTDQDKLNFLLAVLDKQFLNKDPENLNFIVNLSYQSQRHQIESSVKGWERALKDTLETDPQTTPSTTPPTPSQEEEEKEEGKGKEQEEGEVKEEGQITDQELNQIAIVYKVYPSVCTYKGENLKPEQDRQEIKDLILKHLRERNSIEEVIEPIKAYMRGRERSQGWHMTFKQLLLDLPEYHKPERRVAL